MEPNFELPVEETTSRKPLQWVLVGLLALLLTALVAGYIYIGMRKAVQDNSENPNDSAVTNSDERAEILEALSEDDSRPVSGEDRLQIIEELDGSVDGDFAAPEDRQSIIESL